MWDNFFTVRGVWGFSEAHITGVKIGALPVEEILFFVTVPYCCVFVYECIRCYFPNLKQSRLADALLLLMGMIFLVVGFTHLDKDYTSWTFLLTGIFIFLLSLFKKKFIGFDALSFLVSYLIIIIPFLVINGFLTAIPVVVYNDAENLSFRIFSFLPWPMHNIPFEDIFYGMLLILLNISLFEYFRNRRTKLN
jgi:lycopene cyclase domain-containing protein